MSEEQLKYYFEGELSTKGLSKDLENSVRQNGLDSTTVFVQEYKSEKEYCITRQNLLKLCKDAINENLSPSEIKVIAFVLFGSDFFTWDEQTEDGKIVSNTIFDWDNPGINFPLTKDNFRLWKEYLETGNYKLKNNNPKSVK